MILNDNQILDLCKTQNMINPFTPLTVKEDHRGKILSYGLSSFGYDIRAEDKWFVFNNVHSVVVDPLNFSEKSFTEKSGDGFVIIPPNSFVLTHSVEYINMPEDVMCVVTGKSTIARSGIGCLVTPLEPGWGGHITLEFHNTTPLPVKMYAGMGCCQLLFFRGERPMQTYPERSGKYQGQVGITLPR